MQESSSSNFKFPPVGSLPIALAALLAPHVAIIGLIISKNKATTNHSLSTPHGVSGLRVNAVFRQLIWI
jgi:hypothetical protein